MSSGTHNYAKVSSEPGKKVKENPQRGQREGRPRGGKVFFS
jgi:hypothetical protein